MQTISSLIGEETIEQFCSIVFVLGAYCHIGEMFYVFIISIRQYQRGNQNGQSRETGNVGYTSRRQVKQEHSTICVERHYMQANPNKVNKTRGLLQTTVGKDEPKIYCDFILSMILYNYVRDRYRLVFSSGRQKDVLTDICQTKRMIGTLYL